MKSVSLNDGSFSRSSVSPPSVSSGSWFLFLFSLGLIATTLSVSLMFCALFRVWL